MIHDVICDSNTFLPVQHPLHVSEDGKGLDANWTDASTAQGVLEKRTEGGARRLGMHACIHAYVLLQPYIHATHVASFQQCRCQREMGYGHPGNGGENSNKFETFLHHWQLLNCSHHWIFSCLLACQLDLAIHLEVPLVVERCRHRAEQTLSQLRCISFSVCAPFSARRC
jgi:hypothetical protein